MPLQNPQDVSAHSALDTGVHGVGAGRVVSAYPAIAESVTLADVTRTTSALTVLATGNRATLLSVGAGGGMIIAGLLSATDSSAQANMYMEITIDGAAKQSFAMPLEQGGSSGGDYIHNAIIPPIWFSTSILISFFNNSGQTTEWGGEVWHKA